jgi:hypothetical protein
MLIVVVQAKVNQLQTADALAPWSSVVSGKLSVAACAQDACIAGVSFLDAGEDDRQIPIGMSASMVSYPLDFSL